MACEHASLRFEPSAHAESVGYRRSTTQQRAAAAVSVTRRNKRNSSDLDDISHSAFPGPLILPNDDLALDPRYPPQSLRSWLRLEERNEVTPKKNAIYVAAPPDIGSDVQFVRSWSNPQKVGKLSSVTPPQVADVIDYLSAFYHGLPVKPFPAKELRFASWDAGTSKRSKSKIPAYIGLNTSTECVGIRARPSPDGVFAAQLNLDDLLDAAISILPKDAYALVLLVEHDLFEDDEDIFVCGRAYGGSRVAVISTARYHPNLDRTANVEREHAWPASHCASYMHACADDSSTRPKKKAKLQDDASLPTLPPPHQTVSPIQAAIIAHKALPAPESLAELRGLWLGRVCRTASHELGHCFGIDHCIYYACAMQGSSSLAEDARQPPYLCPVDLAKVLQATSTTAEARYRALLAFCDQHTDVHLFAAFAAWIRAHLARDSAHITV
ncbi:hypothetical protein GALMADRAFT_240156 [Galerina marginata CBS 339.88]|uniref:Uncharacterized protein n=1 Tax=Galerina marginata (strain CBS 339.88) TaxID=685588 RepID=A0A067TPP9_GALM3|nr:hypothetical protein GALMADRAFT_240156 [Galerina marginata CBS 339.88]